jgi:Tol biopolymer transport system component
VELGSSVADRVSVTPDGKQVVYLSNDSGVQAAWIVSADRKPRQLTQMYTLWPMVSPDGKSLAFSTVDGKKQQALAVCPLTNCSSPRLLPIASRPEALRWTPDGRGVAYSIRSNIWARTLDGKPAYPLTRFPEDDYRIDDFKWSADGARQLTFSRSRTSWDIVLFRGLKAD